MRARTSTRSSPASWSLRRSGRSSGGLQKSSESSKRWTKDGKKQPKTWFGCKWLELTNLRLFVEAFEKAVSEMGLPHEKCLLLQGTLYPDVIESTSYKG